MEEQMVTESTGATGPAGGSPIGSIVDTARAVVTGPAEFFRGMPKGGGFGDPLLFMVVMGIASGIVGVVLSFFGWGLGGTVVMALAMIILMPILTIIFGFVAAVILFVIWKLMGSQESFETAFRCAAYMAAITPITTIINEIPFAGALVSLAWSLFLVVTASVEVHRIKSNIAWLVFGIIFILLGLLSISSQYAALRMQNSMEVWNEKMENMDEMSPEEAGQALQQFIKGMQEQNQGPDQTQ